MFNEIYDFLGESPDNSIVANQTILSFPTVLVLSIVVGIIVWLPQLIKDFYSLSGWITNLIGLGLTLLFGTSIFLKNREIRFLKHETIFPFLFILQAYKSVQQIFCSMAFYGMYASTLCRFYFCPYPFGIYPNILGWTNSIQQK